MKTIGEQGEVEIVDVTKQNPNIIEQDPADTIQIDEDIMDTKAQEQEMIEGNAYAKLASSESVLEQIQPYLPITHPVSTETPHDTNQGTEDLTSTKGEATQATKKLTSQAPSNNENVTIDTPRKESPTTTSEAQTVDKSVASTEQPIEDQQDSQAIVLVKLVKSKEKKMKKHSFQIDLSKPIVLPNVDVSKLKGQALIEFGELCKAKDEQEKQMAL